MGRGLKMEGGVGAWQARGVQRERLREALRERRQEVPAEARARWSAAIAGAVMEHPAWARAEALTGFFGMGEEPQTRGLLQAALDQGKRLWLPRVAPARRLRWVVVTDLDTQLVPGVFGLLEPEMRDDAVIAQSIPETGVDLVLMPGLGFSADGARIGFGGGYYDRALEPVARAARPVRMALAFSTFVDPPEGPIPMAAHDVRVHFIATEQGVVDCRPPTT